MFSVRAERSITSQRLISGRLWNSFRSTVRVLSTMLFAGPLMFGPCFTTSASGEKIGDGVSA